MTDIYLSAGHYPGRRGVRYGRIHEYDVVAQIASCVYGQLFGLDRPAETVLVPTGRLGKKIDWINRRAGRDDLAVELHLNAWANYNGADPVGPERDPRGPECWIYRSADERTRRAANAVLVPLESFWRRTRDDAIKRSAGLAFLRRTVCPAVIVEIDFIQTAAYCLAEIGPLSTVLAGGIADAADAIESGPVSV